MIACVILNYNDGENARRLVGEIRQYESLGAVVLVDNSSTDGSDAVLEGLQGGRVHFLRSGKNGGYGFGNNLGIRYAAGLGAEYVIVANPDTSFTEACIQGMRACFAAEDPVVFAGALINLPDGSVSKSSAWKIPSPAMLTLSSLYFAYHLLPTYHYPPALHESGRPCALVECLGGAMFMLHTRRFLELGGYDEAFFLYGEETVLGIKARRQGFKTCLNTTVSYTHYAGDESKTNILPAVAMKKHLLASSELMLRKYYALNAAQMLLVRMVSRVALWEVQAGSAIMGLLRKGRGG